MYMTEPTEIYIFSNFSAGGLHDWRILLVISLEFQEIRHQPFSMTQPKFYFNHLKLKYFFENHQKKYLVMRPHTNGCRMSSPKNAMPPQRMKRKAPAMNLCP